MFLKRKRLIEREAELRGDRPREVSNATMFKKIGVQVERVR